MDTFQIISTFTKEEVSDFQNYLKRKNKRKDAKNIQLFNYFLEGSLSTNEMCLALYQTLNKDAYHALKKRLNQSIIDFIATKSLEGENSNEMQLFKLILVAKKFLANKQYHVGYKILDKAEVIAKEHYFFPFLNEIYHTKIEFANSYPKANLDNLIEKFNKNQEQLILEDKLNIVYAKVKEALYRAEFKAEILDFQSVIDRIIEEQNISLSETMSFKSLYQLLTVINISAFITKDYFNIESFLLNIYGDLENNKDKKRQLYYHIQVVYMIANTLFRNKKFTQSLSYLEVMGELMNQHKGKYFSQFILKYHLLLGLNYNYSNRHEEAIQLFESHVPSKNKDIESLLAIYLSLIMCYFQQGDFKRAYQILTEFYHSDQWYEEKAGKEWVMKKSIIEILLNLELGNLDLVESRLRSFKRRYYPYLKEMKRDRVITYISLVEYYYKFPEKITSIEFKERVKNSFEWTTVEREDIFVMSFYAWLKSKMEQNDLYETTLKLVNKVF